jgi:glutamate synthase domain-containing protein 3
VRFTGSPRGKKLLDTWDHILARFVKVMPTEYKRVLEKRRAANRGRATTASGPVVIAGGGS